jgi:hypothetical protein
MANEHRFGEVVRDVAAVAEELAEEAPDQAWDQTATGRRCGAKEA